MYSRHFSLDLPQWLSGSLWLCCRWGSVPRNLFLALKVKTHSCCKGNLAGWWETPVRAGWKPFSQLQRGSRLVCTSHFRRGVPSLLLLLPRRSHWLAGAASHCCPPEHGVQGSSCWPKTVVSGLDQLHLRFLCSGQPFIPGFDQSCPATWRVWRPNQRWIYAGSVTGSAWISVGLGSCFNPSW